MSNIKDGAARTCGDGMENEVLSQNEIKKVIKKLSSVQVDDQNNFLVKRSIPGENLIYRPAETCSTLLQPTVPQGKIFHLIPRLVLSTKPSILKSKEPRFVPIEPYKAAVNPIIPFKKSNKRKINKNNLDLHILVSQMSDMKTSELSHVTFDNASLLSSHEDLEKLKCDEKLKEMKKEKEYYESQLKFQVQVNTELKNLLVAAVGEDLQTRVHVLTEDKLQLARALVDSAQHLSSHTEQIEYLAGQSEVWRSKFLASSLMVEELARWKASLTQKNNLLSNSNKELLQMCSKLRDMHIEILKNLKFLAGTKVLNLPSSNIVDLTAESLNISQQLILHSGIGMPENLQLNGLEQFTDAEKLAVQALQTLNQPLMDTDEAFRAIVGQAFPSFIAMKKIDDNKTLNNTNVNEN